MFKEIDVKDIKENVVKLIGSDWALLTAKNGNTCNPMTVSWGGIGMLWGKPTATVYVRQSRFTKGLIDNEEYFSLSFYNDEYKDALKLCGVKSGRDIDKVKETGLTEVLTDKAPYFEEAKLVLICKKSAKFFLDKEGFIDDTIMDKWYSDNDMHDMYLAEIEKVLISD